MARKRGPRRLREIAAANHAIGAGLLKRQSSVGDERQSSRGRAHDLIAARRRRTSVRSWN